MNKPEKKTSPGRRTSAHFVLQGKGGVGKSLVASMLAQYFTEAQHAVRCYDTDPINSTLARYKALNVTHLPLLAEGQIDVRRFDTLMEDVLSSVGSTFVIDNGAATFIPLGHYLAENNAFSLLAESAVDAVTHCVVTGGQALQDTMIGLDSLCKLAHPRSVVVWINEYFGPVEYNGAPLTDLPVYANNAAKLRGTVTLPRRNADTFGADIGDMVCKHLTFDQAMASSDVPLMAKSRLKMVKQTTFGQLDEIGLC